MMVAMVSLPLVNHGNNTLKLNIPGFEPQIRELVYKGVLFPLADVEIRFVMEAKDNNIVPKTSHPSIFSYTAMLCSLEIV